jgi:hypothetical protein
VTPDYSVGTDLKTLPIFHAFIRVIRGFSVGKRGIGREMVKMGWWGQMDFVLFLRVFRRCWAFPCDSIDCKKRVKMPAFGRQNGGFSKLFSGFHF